MKIIYELNPPKIFYDSHVFYPNLIDKEIVKFIQRAKNILAYTNYIHITDSVLGIPRISSTHAVQILANHKLNGKKLKNKVHIIANGKIERDGLGEINGEENMKNKNSVNISCSVRNRDRNINSIIQIVTESIHLKISDLLFIMGDMPNYEDPNNQKFLSKPTETIQILNQAGFNKYINLNLSISNKITDEKKIEKKIKSKPHAMITQTISSINEIQYLDQILKPHVIKLIPCIMVPSEKNVKAAKMIGLNWEEYSNDFFNFLFKIEKFVDTILLTSPNDFKSGIQTLEKISRLQN